MATIFNGAVILNIGEPGFKVIATGFSEEWFPTIRGTHSCGNILSMIAADLSIMGINPS